MLLADIIGDRILSRSSAKGPIEVREADSFPRQWEYVTTEARFSVVVCSRRAGKTEGAIRRAARVLLTKHKARVLYLALIRRNAKKQFFGPLRDYLAGLGLEVNANETDLTITLPGGAYVECGSCGDSDDIAKHRGDKWDLVLIDEAQGFRTDVITPLVDEVVLPSLVDRKGALTMLGTPPPAGPVGYFYDVFASGKWQRFRWTLFDNPHIPADEVQLLCEARGLTPDHAIYQREFLGEFVVDTESMVYEYDETRNGRREGDLAESDQWRYSMGLDLGFSDRDAIVILGWRRDDPTHALVEVDSWQQNHLDVDQLAAVFVEKYRRWKPVAITGDTGGHGAVKVLKSLQARLGNACVIASKPASLLDSIALVNDDLRTGRLRVDAGGPIAHDAKLTTWAPGKIKQEVSDAYHSDVLDALRYAHWGARHWTGKAAPAPKSYNDQLGDRIAAKEAAQRNPWRRKRAA